MHTEYQFKIAYGLLIVCAAARLLLQMAALPPYAGLDEVYHVARLAFVRAEHRNPTTTELSIPPYLMESIEAAHAPARLSSGAWLPCPRWAKPATAGLRSWQNAAATSSSIVPSAR